jgi:phospholipid/cholesterol/gamma-HCH transport system permease protein
MRLKNTVADLQDFYILSLSTLVDIFRPPFRLRETLVQMDYAGVGSLFMVFWVSLFIGMALTLQTSTELARFGLNIYAPKIVGISMVREIGPVAIAMGFAGRVGSGMASELGSMVLGHQVDMLRVYGINVVNKLVAPRVLSGLVMLPVLTVIGDLIALLGGYYIAVFVGHQSGPFYWRQIETILNFETIAAGTVKPFIFGFLITCISCYAGLSTKDGAGGLRTSTTFAVVVSTLAVIVTDFVATRILLYLFGTTL